MPALSLKDFPIDVRKYVLSLQVEAKKSKQIQRYSFYQVLFKIIREHQAMNGKLNNDASCKIAQMKNLLEDLEKFLK